MSIIILVSFSKILHTPMYFFLTQLSIADTMLSTDIAPNLIKIIIHERAPMSFFGCIIQMYFFSSTEAFECLLLMVMSYDRYLAICSPLHYTSIMTNVFCTKLVLASWLSSNSVSLLIILCVAQLHFCGPNAIDHFFCDFNPVLELSCSDTFMVQLEAILSCIPVVAVPFFVIVVSYTKIVLAILKLSSSGRLKSFSTCSSHLTVVCLFYGTLSAIYMLPKEGQSLITSKVLAMLYTVFTPFLNPFIYSLRNKDIKEAVRKAVTF
ncbi:olfactory receptor 10A7-like [Gastrophryne carolinensis]